MSRIHSFRPVADADAAFLILGSMPGAASLAAGQYYAHPRNLFWRIMGEVCGARAALPYPERLLALRAAGFALWDVLGSCVRPGSADADIERSSIKPNNFAAFFREHPGIKQVFFNGAKAEECYRRYVLPALGPACRPGYRRLPSTSPAYASVPCERKLRVWKAALAPLLRK
ncbi:MAG TPA: DNA-deoxyinosine glycosylase [Elusimicrobiales bacterium]|nr:DNA-deoxyinosine glycosylase [Elusimicrobiales bacterium]